MKSLWSYPLAVLTRSLRRSSVASQPCSSFPSPPYIYNKFLNLMCPYKRWTIPLGWSFWEIDLQPCLNGQTQGHSSHYTPVFWNQFKVLSDENNILCDAFLNQFIWGRCVLKPGKVTLTSLVRDCFFINIKCSVLKNPKVRGHGLLN